MVEGTVQAYRRSGIEMEARGHEGVSRFFRDTELLEPGIVAIEDWYPKVGRRRRPALPNCRPARPARPPPVTPPSAARSNHNLAGRPRKPVVDD
ncbi:SAM-dependent methyltransferase [Nocardia sp. NPDC024068]|uniref:SAM-dependent methyltransferase n=1 Tax=Nocardia sp. NPDC024068 TaxID=3157197 RepID=UPI0033EA19C9